MDYRDLNDSMEIYTNTEEKKTEIEIVKYLNNLGIRTKTDPLQKEQEYWRRKKLETQKKMLSILCLTESTQSLILNEYASKLLHHRVSQSFFETRMINNTPTMIIE
ncbi:unnamed protein product (macronuclear) [Paramecium tetraurelia]|uniref:Uncharacterized protein n=1 Tax=Paramecium tetraurelia TaxID=5888 RepID=A0BDN7_PARTE|nr:uncharacterized protein GSPATT00027684001 [Paramecium tetraurelia]CAK56654.1 unnamed protein product [Paramecium tetraurelia]|eukprot:XP_001424052.1 hypothetical protein (macronuclear) [Paramecium tetraurelia strain d4-2]